MNHTCRIELLGGLRVLQNGRILTRLETRKTGALLAYLAFFRHRSHPRETLAEMLWPDEAPEAIRNRLKQALSALRRALEPPGTPAGHVLIADRVQIQLNPQAIATDVAEFEALLHAGVRTADPAACARLLEQALPLYQGELLPGYYEDWMVPERERLAEAYRNVLSRLMKARARLGDLHGALDAAQRAVQADPLREASHYDLMRLYAADGRLAEALRQYHELERVLKEELDTVPSHAGRRLAELLQGGGSPPNSPDSASGTVSSSPPSSDSPHVPREPAHGQPSASIPHNLPALLTSFIGREQEIVEIRRLLSTSRLLTLAGTGGCGKTRLSLQVAGKMLEAYPDGVWLVKLEALSERNLVAQAVASPLGVQEEAGRSLAETVIDALKPKTLLLVLDNCEHLLEECARLITRILENCAQVKVLATSREALNVPGELVWRVPSLRRPERKGLPREEKALASVLMEYDSVRLFVERARFQRADFALDRRNAEAVAQVCSHLEGIPLAIELAAARVRVMSMEQIVRRLDDRFGLLTGGSRTASSRQQTLRATMDWSYDLLSPQERVLLGRLSVFAGGWSLEAAEQVCSDLGLDGDLPLFERREATPGERGSFGNRQSEIHIWEVVDVLASLVDKSLVFYEEQQGEARYRLLETVRQYGWERLEQTGELAAWRDRHRDYFLELAELAEPQLTGSDQVTWLQRLETEHDNLRWALEWRRAEEEGAETELRLAGALARFWQVRGYLSEGRGYLAAALGREGAASKTKVRAKALRGIGGLAWIQADYAAAKALHEESLAIGRALGDESSIADSLNGLGLVNWNQGDYGAARALFEESLAIKRNLGNRWGIATALNNLGILASEQGDYAAARALHEESLAIKRESGDKWGISISFNNLGTIAHNQGDFAAARSYHAESLAIRQELGDQWGIAYSLHNLGLLADDQGDYGTAKTRYEEGLAIRQELGDRQGISTLLNNLGAVASVQGDYVTARMRYEQSLEIARQLGYKQGIAVSLGLFASLAIREKQVEHAVRLWAAADAVRKVLGSPTSPREQEEHDRHLAAAREVLGVEKFAAFWEEGTAMPLEAAIDSIRTKM